MSARQTIPEGWWECGRCGNYNAPDVQSCPTCAHYRQNAPALPCQPASAPPIATPDEPVPARKVDRGGKGQPSDFGISEKALQTAAEGWLNIRGYWRSTAANAETRAVRPDYLPDNQRGWFFHWPQAIGNPLCADLLIQNVALTRSLWLELKVRDKYQRGQKEHIDASRWNECRTLDDVMNVVQLWELTL